MVLLFYVLKTSSHMSVVPREDHDLEAQPLAHPVARARISVRPSCLR